MKYLDGAIPVVLVSMVNNDSPRFPPDLEGVAHALELVAREAEAQVRGNPA